MSLTDIVSNALDVAWVLRWVIVAIAFALLGAAYAVALMELRGARHERDELEDTLAARDESIRRLRAIINAQQFRRRRPTPIVSTRALS